MKDLHTTIDIESEKKKNDELMSSVTPSFFGINMDKFSRSTQLIACILIIFVLFLMYGYCQEWLFRLDELKKNGMFVTLVQFGLYSLFGILEQISHHGIVQKKIPVSTYVLLALLTIGTMGLSNTSLGYLNYPTQVIFKSSKLIPVMIGGILIQGKKYSFIDFSSCALMTIGLILFTFADQTVSPNFDITGVILISFALCADAAIGNVQEKALKKYSATNAELVLYSYGSGFIFILVGYLFYGGALQLFLFLFMNPKVFFMLCVFSLTGYIGILFVLQVVRTFGALLAVTVTTCRKAVTMVLSFLFFAKPFTMQYVWSGMLVLLGISLNIYSKNRSKIDFYLYDMYQRCLGRKSAQSNNV